jgi:Ni,Fe-hydrogenase III small subunit
MVLMKVAVVMGLRGDQYIGQLAKQIDEHHVVEGTGSCARNAGIGNHDGQALGAGDGHVYPVAVENKGQPP